MPLRALQNEYLIAIHQAYAPDTIREITPFIYLEPLSSRLGETIVKARGTKRILRSAMEYVVDYDFEGDNILVASYSGNNGRNAKLFLLNIDGDTLALTKLPQEPIGLYKSCVGRFYCICFDKFYPLSVDSNSITLGKPYAIRWLPLLQQCQVSWDGTLYYKIAHRDSFKVTYGFISVDDSVFHPFLQLDKPDAYASSREEDVSYTEKEWLMQQHKFDNGLLRALYDKGNWDIMNIPLFKKEDSLLVFDFTKRKIHYYNLIGAAVKDKDIIFPMGRNFRPDIIKDPLTERFYLHLNTHTPVQRVREIELEKGDIGEQDVQLDKPFAEDIKVHNGDVYYLWQDSHHYGTRQLFVQKGFD